jgi:hypothetical protein
MDIDRSLVKRSDGSYTICYRYIAEKVLGRKLKSTEVVHHHGHQQLVLCQDESYHKLLHIRTAAYKVTGDVNKRKCVFCKKYDSLANLTLRVSKEQSKLYYHEACEGPYRAKFNSEEKAYRIKLLRI